MAQAALLDAERQHLEAVRLYEAGDKQAAMQRTSALAQQLSTQNAQWQDVKVKKKAEPFWDFGKVSYAPLRSPSRHIFCACLAMTAGSANLIHPRRSFWALDRSEIGIKAEVTFNTHRALNSQLFAAQIGGNEQGN